MISTYLLAAFSGVLLVFLLYKEWKRPMRLRLAARLLATVLLVTSLYLMTWPVTDQQAVNSKQVLLTPGFNEDSVANWINKNGKAANILSADPSLRYNNAVLPLLADFTSFSSLHLHDTLQVFGNGLAASKWAMLAPMATVVHPPADTRSITDIFWQQQLEPGAPLIIQGNYENASNETVSLQLLSFGAVKDSLAIAGRTQQHFQLRTVPLHSGRAVYTLLAIAGKDTLCQEPVPVSVNATRPLRLLIIASAPDFENTYLKNHLAGKGFSITMTTTVSNNKTERQFLNTALQDNEQPLTADYLAGFDVLLSDPETLRKINTTALRNVRAAVQKNGLGLLVRMDSVADANAFYSAAFSIQHLPATNGALELFNADTESIRFLFKTSNRTALHPKPGTKVILQDADSNAYAAAALAGNGFVVATSLQQTYSIALAGNQAAYQQLWATLLHAAAKSVYTEEEWRAEPFFSFQHAPVSLQLEGNEPPLPVALADSVSLHLQQDTGLLFIWRTVYWPVQGGWHNLPGANDSPAGWYVYPKESWQQVIQYQHRQASMKYAAAYTSGLSGAKEEHNGIARYRQLWLFLLFIASCTFLWVEQKLS